MKTMEPNRKAERDVTGLAGGALLLLMLLVALAAIFGAGCTSTRNLSESETQAQIRTVTEAVRMAYAEAETPVMADFLSNVPKSGAAGYTKVARVIRGPDGNPVMLPDGTPAMEGGQAVGLLNSMRDIVGVNKAWLVLGGWARNPLTGQVSRDATLDGLFTYLEGGGVESTVSSDFAAVWAKAPAEAKQAAADAVARTIEARKGAVVEAVTATGEAVVGILREVRKATPAGAGLAAVEVLLEKADGEVVPGTITEAFTASPEAFETSD